MATEGSAASRAGQAGPALLELVHLSNKLVLDNVYLNGLHALRRFEVRNVSAFPLTIKLRSNLGSQIAFQLTNENLPERDLRHPLNRDLSSASLSSSVESGLSDIATDRELQQQRARLTSPVSAEGEDHRWAAANSFNPVTTNTVEAAAVGVFQTEHNTLHGHQFNQLFNYVNHIDELKIAPGESQKIILAFLPDAQGRGRRNADKDDQSVDKEAKLEDVANDDETYDFFEVNGLLFFFAYKSQDASLATALPSDSNGSAINETTREHISSSNDTNGSGSRSRSGTGSKKEGDENVALSTQAPPDHQISVKFRSRVCRSVLWTDIGDTGISFDDCVVGETYFKDFSISNRSEIELFWILNMADLSKKQERPWLKLTDYDTGEPLDGRPIPAYSHRRFRLTFRPRDVGEYSYEFQLENANDSSNTVEAACHAVVRSALREESLVVSSGNVVDFGDCLTGLWAKQRLVLRNISEKSLDIAFGSEAQGVVFQLKSDEQGYESAAKGVSIGGDIGNPANDQTKDDPFTRATENSEISFSQSAASSRPGSPSVLGWKHGEAANRGSSSTDLAAMISAAAGFSHADEDGDSEGSGEGDYVQGDGVGHSGEEYRRIEELQLRPGTERVVEVGYRPAKDAPSPDHRGGRLVRRNFRLLLSYSYHGTLAKERKAIQCKARTCTSFIDVNPKIVNFGDTDVGTLKSAPILITNCSDLPARVELRFVSKVLNTFRDEILIPPKQSTEAKVDIYPRKVNPEYRKQLTVVNVLNRENDQHVEVRSTNVDQNRVTFHSLFYRILTPTSSNFVDFGEVILNSTVARSLTIANISKKRLVLQITSSSPDEIKIYGRGAPNSPTMEPLAKSTAERRERLLESISDRRKLQRVESAAATAATTAAPTKIAPGAPKMRSMADIFETASADYLDLASTLSVKDGRRSPRRKTVQHQVGALKQLRAQYREATGSGQEEESADIRPSLSARLGLPTKDSLSIGEVPAKPDMDPDSERFSKSLEAALRNVETGTQRSGSKVNEGSESATLSVNTLVSMFDAISGVVPPTFQKASGEERYVRTRLHLNREIESAIKDGRLAPLSQLEIAPESDMPLLLLFMPDGESKPYIQAKARKVDYRVFIRLIEFDRDIEQPQFEQLLRGDQDMIPVRELLLRSSLSRSMMELNQKNINFGVMEKNEHRTKTIVIRNNSEAPLLYAIRKSGSIASGDLILGDGRMGIVRGHGKREVEFMFDPSLAGPFHERLTIENVQDRTNDLSISVKATIRRPAPFMLESDAIDFGPCLIDDTCMTAQTVVVSNTSFKKTRMFEIRADPAELHFKKCTGTFIFDLVDNEDDYVEEAGDMQVDGAPIKRRRPLMMLSKEMEEEIEHLEQKLKIAKRKGHKDKVKKLLDKLHKLRAGIVGDDYNEDSTKSQGSALGAEGLTDTGKGPTGDTTPKASESAFTQLIDPELSSGISSMNPSRRASQVNLGTDAAPADTPSPVVSLLQFKVKRTDHGIVFALEPRTIRTISVRFRPISSDAPAACAMQGGEDAPLVRNGSDSKLNDGPGLRGSEYIASKLITNEAPDAKDCVVHVSGKLYVHEHKNMDITKEVDFSATVHLDPAAFFDQLPQKRDGKRGQSDASPNPEYLPIRDTPETQPDSRSPSPLFISRPVHSGGGKAPAAPLQSPVGASQLFAAPPSSARVVTSPVDAANIPLIEVPIIDLGNVKINERKDCYFTFTNRGSGALPYKLDAGADGLLQGYESFGVLSGGETRRVDMHFVPTTFGRQSCSLSVQSEGNGERTIVTFSFYVVASSYLRFPSLPDPAASTVELDFGYCYVDPKRKFARVLSFPIENVSDDELYISAISNLAQQCYIFTDVETESPAVNLRIAPHSTETVFIALQPYFGGSSARRQVSVKGQTPTSGANTSQTEPSAGGTEDFRTLVGGIKFLVQKKEVSYKEAQQPSTSAGEVELPHIVADELYQLMTYTAKFNAIIGQSLMSVSTTLVDLGTISNLGAVYVDSFFVCNMSSRMPLEFSVKAPDGLELEPYTGRIDAKRDIQSAMAGRETGQGGNERDAELPDTSSARECVGFELHCTQYGLTSLFLEIVNANNSSQRIEVEVRIFADINWLELHSTKALAHPPPTAQIDGRKRLPSLRFDNAYVDIRAGDGKKYTVPPSPTTEDPPGPVVALQRDVDGSTVRIADSGEQSVELRNVSDKHLRLVPKSTLQIFLRWILDPHVNDSNGTPNSDASVELKDEDGNCGPAIDLAPGQKVTAIISTPEPKFKDDTGSVLDSLLAGKKAAVRGMLLFQDAVDNLIVKAIELRAHYGVSKGEIDPPNLDLGKVGYHNAWASAKFRFSIKNTAEIPLQYEVQAMEAFEFSASVDNADKSLESANTIGSRGIQWVEGVLHARQLSSSTAGPQTFLVAVNNIHNKQNVMMINVQVHITVFDLRFDRLEGGALKLPPLTHPQLPTALPCDTWFSICNTADEEARFEIGYTASVNVADFVRLDVLSRFSNSPLTGSVTLSPKGSIEVRVRAYAKEQSRLPAQPPETLSLTNPDGVPFGDLWIVPKLRSSENGNERNDDTRITEHIPIMGTIVEGQTFTLSEEQITFRIFMASDSDDEEASETNEADPWAERRSSTDILRGDDASGKQGLAERTRTQKEIVYVTNLSNTSELEFRVTFEFPLELPNGMSVLKAPTLSENMTGKVPPGGRFPLLFELLNPKIGGVSDDIRVLVSDVKSRSLRAQVLYVSIVEDTSAPLPAEEGEEDQIAETLFVNDASESTPLTATITGRTPMEDPSSSLDEEDDNIFSDAMSSSSLRETDRGSVSVSTKSYQIDTVASPVPHVRRSHAVLSLRGCKRLSETKGGHELDILYELDFGQQDLGAPIAVKKLSLENPSSERVSYRIRILNDAERSWLSFSRNEGTLEGGGRVGVGIEKHREAHTVSVNVATHTRGVYTTYIFIENLDNPADIKTVRVSTEIVARQNVRRTAASTAYAGNVSSAVPVEPASNRVFDVYVHGADSSVTSFVMDPVYFETEYVARSMIICNREAVPLEFTIHSSLSPDDDTDLLFSLSRTTAKLFRSIIIEAESQARIYVRLRPSIEMVMRRSEVDETAVQNRFPTTLAAANVPFEKTIEIYVNCRLVKDYQKIIPLRCICYQPQLLLSQTSFTFRGIMRRKHLTTEAISREDEQWSIQLLPLEGTLEVANLLTDPMECCVMNDSQYFTVECIPEQSHAKESDARVESVVQNSANSTNAISPSRNKQTLQFGIEAQKFVSLRVVPNMEALLKHISHLRREKYIVEHFTVYNRNRPREKTFVVLKLSFGQFLEFQSASGSRHSYAILESQIVRLLRDLQYASDLFNPPEPDAPVAAEYPDLLFRYIYIVDQLVYCGTREHAAENYAHLAQLLFSSLFGKSAFRERAPAAVTAWPPYLTKWINIFTYFLEFFPQRWPSLDPLRDLLRNLLGGPTVNSISTDTS